LKQSGKRFQKLMALKLKSFKIKLGYTGFPGGLHGKFHNPALRGQEPSF
jgi:hypothetical protein